VVVHSTRDPKINGSNPATGTVREKVAKNVIFELHVVFLIVSMLTVVMLSIGMPSEAMLVTVIVTVLVVIMPSTF